MAQRVVVTLSDDIDGWEAAETVAFGLDGKSYEIDLNPANAKKLRRHSSPYVDGRPQAVAAPARPYQQTAVAPDPAAVRAWARSNKMDVPARGRIPKKVYEAFAAASEPARRSGGRPEPPAPVGATDLRCTPADQLESGARRGARPKGPSLTEHAGVVQ